MTTVTTIAIPLKPVTKCLREYLALKTNEERLKFNATGRPGANLVRESQQLLRNTIRAEKEDAEYREWLVKYPTIKAKLEDFKPIHKVSNSKIRTHHQHLVDLSYLRQEDSEKVKKERINRAETFIFTNSPEFT